MKILIKQLIILLILTGAVASAKGQATYLVTDLASFGGVSRGNSITNNGWVSGYSNNATSRRATLWINGGTPIDLGSLGGPNGYSSVVWPVKNNNGLIAGISQTTRDDPNNENWSCSVFLFG